MNTLFSFPKSNKDDWAKKASQETSQKEVLEALSFYQDTNLKIFPYYDETQLPTQKHFALGLNQGNEENKHGRIWQYIQHIYIDDESLTNKKILHALQNGAEGTIYHIQKNYSWNLLFKDIFFDHTHSFFSLEQENNAGTSTIKGLHTAIQGRVFFGGGIKTHIVSVEDLRRIWDLFGNIKELRIVSINGDALQEKGASATFELASIASSLVFQVNVLLDLGVPAADIFKRVLIYTATGRDFFYEIAKLRAMRILISKIALEYGLDNFDGNDIYIYSQPSLRHYSTLEADNHIIRTTTQALSSVIGGCNYLSIADVYPSDNFFYSTLMRNISHIFQYESYLDKVADPLAGAYYLEALTESLSRSAWEYFRELERKGGWQILQKDNFFETELKVFQTKEMELLHKDYISMVGVNAFIDRESAHSLPTVEEYTKSIEKFHIFPIAKELELIRLQTEEHVKKSTINPCIFIYGLESYSPKVVYAQNFFSAGGFSTQMITEKELQTRAIKVIVLCGSDDSYSKDAKNIISHVKNRNPSTFIMLVTESPENIFFYKALGIDEIIYPHSDKREILNKVQKYLYS